MIEIRLRDHITEDPNSPWVQTTCHILIENINFRRSEVRIDGVVYTEESEEFRLAFKRAKLWMTLSDE